MNLDFRKDIEGLRGVAILLVVLAHAGVPGLSAGFVGVDVFFVISGFLITGLLTEELRATGKVDFWAFYARRARRLAPALLLMVLVVSAAALVWVPRGEIQPHVRAAIAALLWVSNIHFAYAGFDYFGPQAGSNLFLHTWSLGVEEQFYLIWPATVLVAWRWGGTGRRWLLALVIAGFIGSWLITQFEPQSAYYLMPSRLWQLALGGLAYRLAGHWKGTPSRRGESVAVAGVIVLAVGLLLIDDQHAYPGWQALLPSCGAALLLLGPTLGGRWVTRALEVEPLRWIGRVSYSWYLWHWPLLALLPAAGLSSQSPTMILGLVLVSFLLALASFYAVEQPIRRGRFLARRSVAAAVLASVALAIGLHFAQSWRGAVPREEMNALERAVYLQMGLPGIYGGDCDQWYHSAELVPCDVGDWETAGGTMVLIADSVGAQWVPALERVAREQRRRLVVLTKSSCPIAEVEFFYPRIRRRYTECETWRDRAVAYVHELRPEVVLIGSFQYTFPKETLRDGTIDLLRKLAAPERRLVVIAPTPLLPFDGPRCVLSTGRREETRVVAPSCEVPLSEQDPRPAIDALQAAASAVPGAELLYLNDVVCPEGVCRAMVAGRLTYRDNQHLSAGYAEDLGTAFEARLNRLLEPTALAPTP